MHTAPLIRAGWVMLSLFAFASVALAQGVPSATPTPIPIRIGYTGKLLGYFRVPSEQPRDSFPGCPARADNNSVDATTFLQERDKYRDAVLVGTGDNFSPQLESRVFKAEGAARGAKEYLARNKELYTWDKENKRWIPLGGESDDLKELLKRGEGTIPTDNVGCFLAAAGFSAVVPGKHDFYFGTERVRQLARFMAGINQKDYSPVQMLGANLVIKTTRLDGNQAPATTEEWPKNVSAQNLKSVYPWFSVPISLKLTAPKGEKYQEKLKEWHEGSAGLIKAIEALLADKTAVPQMDADERDTWSKFLESLNALNFVYICPAGEYNEVSTEACLKHGYKLEQAKPPAAASDDYSMTYSFPMEETNRADRGGKDGHYATFLPGQNYGLCLGVQSQPGGKGDGGEGGLEKKCTVFSVNTPFLSYPRRVPSIGSAYTDPDPFVFIPNTNQANEVAIFGVLDPHIAEQVGVLNFSWLQDDPKLKSDVAIENPIEAIKQQLDYFNQWYKEQYETRGHKPFSGLKILLAQMSPQRARLLATNFPEFQVVVAGADETQASDETEQSIVWTGKSRAGAFVAVPSPAFDTKKGEVVVSLGMIRTSNDGDEWKLSSDRPAAAARPSRKLVNERGLAEVEREKKEWEERQRNKLSETEQERKERERKEREKNEDVLSKLLRKQLDDCLSEAPEQSERVDEQLKLLTLCAMRQRMGADVALLQKRDFFFNQIPVDANDVGEFQSILDRAIWKGDLLTLLYVPGSALKNALKQSEKYEQDDSDPVSLADEKSRGLVVLGAEKKGKEYVVNELPIDDKKVYAVATTDYISAGDTGYPDLDAAALNRKTIPAKFPRHLEPISSVVCRKLLSDDEYDANCLHELDRDTYLDKIAAQAAPRQRPTGLGKKLLNLSPFKWPDETKDPETLAEAAEQDAQRHPVWMLSLQNFSLGFTRVSNNLTDDEVNKKFAGVPTSGISSSKFQRVMTVGLTTRASRISHRREFFFATKIDFKGTTTGDGSGNKFPDIVQDTNRLTADIGMIRSIRGGRSQDRVGVNFSFRAETPFARPFTIFKLGTGDPLKVIQRRSLLLLPRVGLYWQNGTNTFEVGAQAGTELRALAGYQFETQGVVVECLPNAEESFSKCVERLSTSPNTSITKDSVRRAILANRPRAGAYFNFNVSVPFGEKVKYEVKNEGDFFFVNWHGANATDTKYRDELTNSLKFFVWPNLSFGPTLKTLFYRNKVNGTFLFQKNFGLEATFNFDIFNHRERKVQLRNKSATASK